MGGAGGQERARAPMGDAPGGIRRGPHVFQRAPVVWEREVLEGAKAVKKRVLTSKESVGNVNGSPSMSSEVG